MTFSDLGLGDEVLRAIADAGYSRPTPVQEQTIPSILMGRDVWASAQTGTGKTASFTLPMIEILANGRAKSRMPRSLILEPTRELAAQVADNFEVYGKYNKLTKALIIGGEGMADQIKTLDRGVDVLIATPGRLLDLFERGGLLLHDIKVLVIDEADRMLDMGFIPDVEKIVGLLPKIRQTLMFSATLMPEVRRLASSFLVNPKEVQVDRPASTATAIVQNLVFVRNGHDASAKRAKLRDLIRAQTAIDRALIFCNRKRDVDVLGRSLISHGFKAARLHGDMTQPARTAVLDQFRSGDLSLLVCSDVAARGLDIVEISHVFNYDVPIHAEDYVHRIGRTGRAGRSGFAYTLATSEDSKFVRAIETMIGKPIPRLEGDIETTSDSSARAETPRPRHPRSGRSREHRPPAARNHDRSRAESPNRPRNDTPPAQPVTSAPEAQAPIAALPITPVAQAPVARPAPQAKAPVSRKEERPGGGFGDHMPAFLMRPATSR